jgi:NAD(P)-dependent dehydrogenase (short-subunit alcohol dehydrogenase family)
LSHVEPKAWDDVMAINVTANWHLIRCMEPLLLQSDAGRAVFLSSGVSWLARAYWGPYAVSKAALNTMVQTWAAETTKTNLRVNLFTPGPIRTRMRAQAMPGEDPMTLDTPEQVASKIVEMCLPSVTESGKVYAYPKKQMLSFRTPD